MLLGSRGPQARPQSSQTGPMILGDKEDHCPDIFAESGFTNLRPGFVFYKAALRQVKDAQNVLC